MADIFLNALDVAKEARKAFNENRLQFQHNTGTKICKYRPRDDIGCAIGVSLPDELARMFDRIDDPTITNLIDEGYVDTDDWRFLEALQKLHDKLVTDFSPETQDEFLKLIDERIESGR